MTVLHAGEIGRFRSVSSIEDSDDLTILRGNALFRITAETLAAYIVAENTTIKEITFVDSPYTVLATDERIYVDADTNNPSDDSVVVKLISLATAPLKAIHVQKTDASIATVTITADGSDTINGASTKVILSQYVDIELVPATEWRPS